MRFSVYPAVYPSLRFRGLPSTPNIGLQLLLTRTNQGEQSFARWQGIKLVSKSRDDYPALAQATIAGHPPGSSAGGERSKFGALIGNQHMLVKFAGRGGVGDMAARRWCDLLILEEIALHVAASHGIPAANTNVIETPDY